MAKVLCVPYDDPVDGYPAGSGSRCCARSRRSTFDCTAEMVPHCDAVTINAPLHAGRPPVAAALRDEYLIVDGAHSPGRGHTPTQSVSVAP